MKTINQVLLALIFAAFSTAGFAQSQTTLPQSTLIRLADERCKMIELEDEEDNDDQNKVDVAIEHEEVMSKHYLKPLREPLKFYQGYTSTLPNQQ
jgi:hypothetical protein